MSVVLRRCGGSVRAIEASDHRLLLGKKPGNDLLSLPRRVAQRFPVAEIDLIGNTMDRHHRHDTSPMDFEESLPQLFFQFPQRHSRRVGLPASHMDLSDLLIHQYIKDRVAVKYDILSI